MHLCVLAHLFMMQMCVFSTRSAQADGLRFDSRCPFDLAVPVASRITSVNPSR